MPLLCLTYRRMTKFWNIHQNSVCCKITCMIFHTLCNYHRGSRANHVLHVSHLGRVTHICVSKLTIIDSDHGLSPGLRQAIIWTNAGILLIRTPGTNFSEISSEIHTFSFKKMHSKMLLSGVPDFLDRNKILSGGDLSHYQVPHCIRVFFNFVWFVFIHHNFQFYFELCTYCNILDIYLS